MLDFQKKNATLSQHFKTRRNMTMTISVKKGILATTPADLFVIPVREGEASELVKTIDQQLDGFIADVLKDEDFTGKKGQTLIIHTHHKIPAKRILVIGLGKTEEVTLEKIRRASAIMINHARALKAKRISISVETLVVNALDPQDVAHAFTEGALLADYQFLTYKGEGKKEADKQKITDLLCLETNASLIKPFEAGISHGTIYAQATTYARDLINTPALHMTPKDIAAEAKKLSAIPGVKVKIYNEAEIRKLGLNSFLAVAAGSDEEAYFIHLTYTPKKKVTKKIAICGKGITFDSGGLSLKPAQYMDGMKCDMAGAAAVLAMFKQFDRLQPTAQIHGVIAATENMPSGKALRPGDVIKAYNGKTIEVINTDAEGRLILCDAIAWSEKTLKPDYIIDIATLTGAAIVALGQEVAAMMGTSPELLQKWKAASETAGEPMWELPLVEEYKDLMKSPIADLMNLARVPWAGASIGGLFLQEFVEKTPWLHVDIAGPAWVEKQILPYAPFGASGFAVRTLLNLVRGL